MTRSADSETTSSLATSTESRSTRSSRAVLCHKHVGVGSGFSTRLARRAIDDSAASTKLFSIDPSARADIDRLCDEIHRVSLQEVSRDVFDALRAGDIVVVDATHMA